jgi:hypothetical protein
MVWSERQTQRRTQSQVPKALSNGIGGRERITDDNFAVCVGITDGYALKIFNEKSKNDAEQYKFTVHLAFLT